MTFFLWSGITCQFLPYLVDNRPSTSSLAIAKYFGKQHFHVIRDIEKLLEECPPDFNQSNFGLVEYADKKGEKRPMQGRSVLHELTQYCAYIMAEKQTINEISISAVAQNMASR